MPRLWPLVLVAALAGLVTFLVWPSKEDLDPYDLSRADDKSRFWVTTYPRIEKPANMNLHERLSWAWFEFKRRHGKHNPAAYSFPASPDARCSIQGLLIQCMEVTGTKYFVAVEIAGGIDFGHTNVMNGAQWVKAFEHAIETSSPIICYDYSAKKNFEDTLMLIRERPGVVKVVPRSKLAAYQKEGLASRP